MTPPCKSRRVLAFALALFTAAAAAQSPAPAKKDPERAEQAYLAGARAVDRKDLAAAQAEFAKAVSLNPDRRDYALAFDLIRQNRIGDLLSQAAKARLTNQPAQADTLFAQARALDPTDPRVLEHLATPPDRRPQFKINPEREFAPPIQLEPRPTTQAFDLRGDVKTVVSSVALAFGITTTFDDSVGAKELHFILERAPYSQTMPILLHMAHLIAVPLDRHSIFVARDTDEIRQRFVRQVEETIFVPGATQTQLQELINIIKNVFDVRQAVIAPASGTILVRAPEDTIKAVNYTIADLVDGGAQVMLEVKLYSVDKTITRTIGLSSPSSFSAFSVSQEAQSIVQNNASAVSALISAGGYVPTGNAAKDAVFEALYLVLSGAVTDAKISSLVAALGTFDHGIPLIGVDAGSGATFNLALNSSDTRTLDEISVRVGDGEETTLRLGERYPVTTSTYSSGISSSLASQLSGVTVNGTSAASLLSQYLGTGSAQTIPIIQYEDLGITFTTTPTVMKSGLIKLKLSLKIESLEGASLDNIPVLNSEVFTSNLTLRDGSTAIMLSDLTSNGNAAVSGIPGLGELPGFDQSAGGTKTAETDHSELVMLVTPHLVRRRSDVFATRPYIFHSTVPVDY
jgi:Flp pilus assembly secretin CpaC